MEGPTGVTQTNINKPKPITNNVLPKWQLGLTLVATFSLYTPIWYFRTLKQLKKHLDLNINPLLRTIGLIIPIVNLVMLYEFFKTIKTHAENEGITASFDPGGWVALMVIINMLGGLPSPYFLLSSLSVVLWLPVQGALNAYWRQQQPELPENRSVKALEVVLITLGAIWWVLVIIGMLTS